ncbi:MAG: HEPN domain-containing protein [Candidatus Paceibacteria bacterium]
MREEIKKWLQQSNEDYEAAEYNFDGGKYYISAFLCQQSIEKALKAFYLSRHQGMAPQSHSLIYLAKSSELPEKYHSFLRELTPKFIDTRYPDASVDLPSNIYDEENTKEIMDKSREILEWIEKNIN